MSDARTPPPPDPLDDAAGYAARTLPPGWSVLFRVETGRAWVWLLDPAGRDAPYPASTRPVHEQVVDAVAYAVRKHTRGKEPPDAVS